MLSTTQNIIRFDSLENFIEAKQSGRIKIWSDKAHSRDVTATQRTEGLINIIGYHVEFDELIHLR